MHDGLPGIVPPDIGDFDNDLRQLRPPGPQAVSDTADRPLDNVSIHDFAFHEYLLATQSDQPNRNAKLSDDGFTYLTDLVNGNTGVFIDPDSADAAYTFFTDIEVGIRQAIIAYWQQTNAQQIADTFQQALAALYADGDTVALARAGMAKLIAYTEPFLEFDLRLQ